MLFSNPRAARRPYDEGLQAILSIAQGRESRAWLSRWSWLAQQPTPVWQLPRLAAQLGIAELAIQDESTRSPLGSFKALGAPIALLRLVLRRWPDRGWSAAELLAGTHRDALRGFVVISATDGNHGRALAAAAQSIGCRCVIVLHGHVSEEREAPIAALGAEIVRIAGNYDASVQEAARLAQANGWQVVSDTSLRKLAAGAAGDVPIAAGESGAAGLAALQVLAAEPAVARQAGLHGEASVMLINTEGATASSVYERLAGRSAASVLAAQRDWLARNAAGAPRPVTTISP